MIRCRFKQPTEDLRPVVWPLRHPYWITGMGGDLPDEYSTIVAYADDEAEILRNWPEAYDLDSEECAHYTFTSRFACPKWFTPPDGAGLP